MKINYERRELICSCDWMGDLGLDGDIRGSPPKKVLLKSANINYTNYIIHYLLVVNFQKFLLLTSIISHFTR